MLLQRRCKPMFKIKLFKRVFRTNLCKPMFKTSKCRLTFTTSRCRPMFKIIPDSTPQHQCKHNMCKLKSSLMGKQYTSTHHRLNMDMQLSNIIQMGSKL